MTKLKNTTGPDPERLKIDGDWEDAVKKALKTPSSKSDDAKQQEDSEDDAGATPNGSG